MLCFSLRASASLLFPICTWRDADHGAFVSYSCTGLRLARRLAIPAGRFNSAAPLCTWPTMRTLGSALSRTRCGRSWWAFSCHDLGCSAGAHSSVSRGLAGPGPSPLLGWSVWGPACWGGTVLPGSFVSLYIAHDVVPGLVWVWVAPSPARGFTRLCLRGRFLAQLVHSAPAARRMSLHAWACHRACASGAVCGIVLASSASTESSPLRLAASPPPVVRRPIVLPWHP